MYKHLYYVQFILKAKMYWEYKYEGIKMYNVCYLNNFQDN